MPTQKELQAQHGWVKGKPVYNKNNQLIIDSNGNLRGELRNATLSGGGGGSAGANPNANPNYGNLGINGEKINARRAIRTVTDATAADTSKNFYMQNPGEQTDAFGNNQSISYDPATGKTSITQNAGGALSATTRAFLNATEGLGNDGRAQAQDANYNYITRDNERNKQREIAAKEQQLANQGVPWSADPNSRYQKELAGIQERYQRMDEDARNLAITTGNETYATNVNAVGTLGTTMQNQSPTFTAFTGGQSNQGEALMNLFNSLSQAELTKLGINKDFTAKLKGIAASKASSGSGGPIIGGVAP